MDTARRGGHPLKIEHRSEDLRPYGRRTFLAVVGAGVTSLLWGPKVLGFTRDALLPVSAVLPPPLRGLVRDGWRIYTVTSIPHFHPATWRLRVDGLVERPVELDYSQLAALPRTEQTRDFHCVTGWSVKNVHWSGVRLTDLLAQAQPKPEARRSSSTPATAPTPTRSRSSRRTSPTRCSPTAWTACRSRARTGRRSGSSSRRCTATRASSG